MRKIIIITMIVAALAGTAVILYFRNSTSETAIEEVFPEGAVSYFRMSDVEKNLKKFAAGDFWQNIRNINVSALMRSKGEAVPEGEVDRTLESYLQPIVDDPVLKEIFGKETAIAFYPGLLSDADWASINPSQWGDEIFDLLSNVFIAIRLKPELQAAEFTSRLFHISPDQIKVEAKKYKEHTISIVEFADPRLKRNIVIAYTKIKDFLVFGVGEKAARSAVDVFLKEKKSFSNDAGYRLVRSDFSPEADVVAYGSLDFIHSFVQKSISNTIAMRIQREDLEAEDYERNMASYEQQVEKTFDRFSGFKAVGFSFLSQKVSEYRLVVAFNKAEMNPLIQRMYACSPGENSSIKFVPENILSYHWNHCFDLSVMVDSALQDASAAYPDEETKINPDEVIASLEQTLNLSYKEDILPAFGNEMGHVIYDIDVGNVFPIPKVMLFISVKDSLAATRVINSLVKKPFLKIESESYQGFDIQYITLPFGVDLQPAYCFLDKYLLISTSKNSLKESISAYRGDANPLSESKSFQKVDLGLTDKNNMISFVRVDHLLAKIRTLTDWGLSWMSGEDKREQAFLDGQRQRLADLKAESERLNQDSAEKQATLQAMTDDLAKQKARGIETSPLEQRIDEAKLGVDKVSSDIKVSEEKIAELEKEIRDFKAPFDTDRSKFYLDSVAIPVLKGMESYEGMGVRVIWDDRKAVSTILISNQ